MSMTPPTPGPGFQPGPQPPPPPDAPVQPSPQAETVAERPHPLSPLVKGWIAIAAVLVIGLQELPGTDLEDLRRAWLIIVAIVVAAFVVPLALGYFSWRYTRFIIDEEQVRIERNFIQHRSERVAFTKIQSVDVTQPLVARLFGLAALRIDVGSGGQATSNS